MLILSLLLLLGYIHYNRRDKLKKMNIKDDEEKKAFEDDKMRTELFLYWSVICFVGSIILFFKAFD